MSYIYIHHICILIYDFSLIALMGHFNPVYKHSGSVTTSLHTRCVTTFSISTFDISADIISHFFPVTVLNVQFHLLWTVFEIYEEHSSLNRVPSGPLPTQVFIRDCRLLKLHISQVCWGGKRSDVCHTKSVHKEKHPKNNYSAANTACNPLKPHEAGQS